MSEPTAKDDDAPSSPAPLEPLRPYNPLSESEIQEIALGIHSNKIWTSQHCNDQQSVHMSFMILSFAGEEIYQWIEANDITVVYEYMDKASPMAIKDMPTFLSASFLSRRDWERVVARLVSIVEALADV